MKRLAFAPAANRQIAGLAADVREEMLGASKRMRRALRICPSTGSREWTDIASE
jgi:hypothetical protein